MYKNFTQTTDGGYLLKKQGIISTILVGGALLVFGIGSLVSYISTKQNNLLFYGLLLFAGGLFMFWKNTKQFIIYPSQKTFKYSKGLGSDFIEFNFEELDGATQEKFKNLYGVTLGNTLKLGFEKNGVYSEIFLGQNVSAENMRSINEEIHRIMSNN
jgi:hypothetical protein